MSTIRIAILDDSRLLRVGLAAMLEEQPDLKVVASFGDGEDIFAKLSDVKPHVLLLDLSLRNQNSLKIVKEIAANLSDTKVVAMDLIALQEDIYQFVAAGVSGFVLKNATANMFLQTIRSVAEGMKILPPIMVDSLFSQIVHQAITSPGAPQILEEAILMTKRERQVIVHIADGLSNKEIGNKLHLSTYTIKSHVHNILEKLALRSRLQIANYAHTNEDFALIAGKVSLLGD